jgi:hypothetical protein
MSLFHIFHYSVGGGGDRALSKSGILLYHVRKSGIFPGNLWNIHVNLDNFVDKSKLGVDYKESAV